MKVVIPGSTDDCFYQCGTGCISCSPERYVEKNCQYGESFSLGSCESEPSVKCIPVNKKQETKMNYDRNNYAIAANMVCPAQNDKQEKIYMVERLNMVKEEKNRDLRQKFGLEDDDPPRTAEEFVQRITDGKYKFRDKTNWLTSFYDRVMWRDPTKEADQDGYNAAYEELDDAFVNTMDEVVVLPEVDGLAALNEFKALN